MSATAEKVSTSSVERVVAELERDGDLDPDCTMCVEHFYPSYLAGKGRPFAPAHKASSGCLSGKRSHCTCDTCF